MRLSNTAEGGTTGATVTTANSGGASGSAFDAVSIGAATTITYDNTQVGHGALSVKIDATTGSAGGYVAWQSGQVGTQSIIWFRLCINVTASPAADALIAEFYGAGTLRCRLWITSTRTLKWTNAAAATIQTSTSALTASTWGRLEGFVIGSATTGRVETNVFTTVDTLTAAQTQNSGAGQNTGGPVDEVRFGNGTGVIATYYLDDVAVCDSGYLGAPGVSVSNLTPPPTSLAAITGVTRTVVNGTPAVVSAPTSGQLWPRGGISSHG